MNVRTVLFGLIALVAAGGTAFLVQAWMDSQRARLEASQRTVEAPAPVGNEILVAKKNLPTGTLLKQEHMRWQRWPEGSLAKTYIKRKNGNMADYVGAVVRQGIFAGEPITGDQVVKPGEQGFLAAVLTDGHRAISVPVNATTGVAGFVFPGDRIDLLLTHKIGRGNPEAGGGGRKKTIEATETVLTNVRILAADQKVDDQTGKPRVSKTVTIEVTPKQAEIVTVAMQLGRLSLSLRGLKKTDEEQNAAMTDPSAPQPQAGPAYESLEQRLAREMTLANPAKAPTTLLPQTAKTAVAEEHPRDAAVKKANEEPHRTKSYALGSDASVLIPGPGQTKTQVLVIHGEKSETVNVNP